MGYMLCTRGIKTTESDSPDSLLFVLLLFSHLLKQLLPVALLPLLLDHIPLCRSWWHHSQGIRGQRSNNPLTVFWVITSPTHHATLYNTPCPDGAALSTQITPDSWEWESCWGSHYNLVNLTYVKFNFFHPQLTAPLQDHYIYWQKDGDEKKLSWNTKFHTDYFP